jgi:hypothetical protein
MGLSGYNPIVSRGASALDRDGTNPWDATGAVGGWENSNI